LKELNLEVDGSVSLGQYVAKWFELKSERDEYKKIDKNLAAEQDQIEEYLIKRMEEENIETIKSSEGTISLKYKSYPNIIDFNSFVNWVKEDLDNRIGFLYKQAKEQAVSELFLETGLLPDGIDVYVKPKLSKRKA